MDSSIFYNDGDIISGHLSQSQALEAAYNETVQNKNLIVKDEAARRLRLRILLLEHDNEDLQEQLALGDDRIDLLEHEGDNLRVQIESAQEEVRRQESHLRAQAREVHTLRAEVASMNGVTMDSTKLLTEKLSLARELATLKPELEHLKSQATYQQRVLAEKLALQRQVNTLEVELETEKRAARRAAQKGDNTELEADYQSRLDTLQKDLAKEKRESTRRQNEMESEFQRQMDAAKRAAKKNNNAEREAGIQAQLEQLQKDLAHEQQESSRSHDEMQTEFQSQLEELQQELIREKRASSKIAKEHEKEKKLFETRYTILESKLEQMRTKLRTVKDQLKESQEEVNQIRAAAVMVTKPSIADVPAKKPRKRAALEANTDNAIATPDGMAARRKRPATKRGRADQTILGEKSMFSITPFLNRTISIAPETSAKDEESENEESGEQVIGEEEPSGPYKEPTDALQPFIETASLTTLPKQRGRSNVVDKATDAVKTVLKEAKPNARKSNPASKKVRAVSNLEMVHEEDGEENEPPEVIAPEVKAPVNRAAASKTAIRASKLQLRQIDNEETGPRIKKRKLGGGTLFDDEDGETTKRPAKVSLGTSKLLRKGGLAGPGGKLKGGLSSGFGDFSPLKKDRRGPGASFLA